LNKKIEVARDFRITAITNLIRFSGQCRESIPEGRAQLSPYPTNLGAFEQGNLAIE
jgi:hypothetical protein